MYSYHNCKNYQLLHDLQKGTWPRINETVQKQQWELLEWLANSVIYGLLGTGAIDTGLQIRSIFLFL